MYVHNESTMLFPFCLYVHKRKLAIRENIVFLYGHFYHLQIHYGEKDIFAFIFKKLTWVDFGVLRCFFLN